MQPELTMVSDHFVYKYERLFARGVQGGLKQTLQEIFPDGSTGPLEFAPVKIEPRREFLAGFYASPPIDITLDRYPTGDASVLAYSLNPESLEKTVNDVVERSDMDIIQPKKDFIATVGNEILIEIKTYNMAKNIAERLYVDLENVWGMVHYMNFLSRYYGMSDQHAVKKASKKFGVPPFASL